MSRNNWKSVICGEKEGVYVKSMKNIQQKMKMKKEMQQKIISFKYIYTHNATKLEKLETTKRENNPKKMETWLLCTFVVCIRLNNDTAEHRL